MLLTTSRVLFRTFSTTMEDKKSHLTETKQLLTLLEVLAITKDEA